MDRPDLNVALSAILTTALDTEPAPFPETIAYLALGSDMQKWQDVKRVLTVGELVTFRAGSIVLTDRGREIANKCKAALSA